MSTKKLCTSRQVITTVYDQLPLDEFVNQLKRDKPTEIFHSYYSDKVPCYFITEYVNGGVMYYANGWADKTPKKQTFDGLRREFSIQGIEQFYYTT